MSGIRVNPYPMPDLLSALENLQQQQDTATLEMSTGSTINRPSDNPSGAAQLLEIRDESSQVDSFQTSIGSVSGQLSTADSTLSSVEAALQRALSLGVEGANGPMSDSDRTDIFNELSGIQNQLISLANTTYQGQYIFAGTANTVPYVVDPTQSSGVRYAGNDGENQVTIGSGYQLQANLPGSQIFNAAGADVFQAISDLITSLNSDSGITAAVGEVTSALNNVTAQRTFYGNAMNQAQTQQSALSMETLNLTQQQNAVGAADMATVASQVASDETAMNATLDAISKMPQTSLFDYLR